MRNKKNFITGVIVIISLLILVIVFIRRITRKSRIETFQNSGTERYKVYYTIFAGREKYLSILKKFLDKLLKAGLVTEVHLWDFTRNENDANYLQTLVNIPGYIVKSVNNKSNWGEYYSYYANNKYGANDIIIKSDDDIIYIDINEFGNFLNEVKGDNIYYPNIINNDVSAYIQTQHGVHSLLPQIDKSKTTRGYKFPLTEWYTNPQKAVEVHNKFLENPVKFKLMGAAAIKWESRISINFFAMRAETARKYYKTFENDDEAYISAVVWTKYPGASSIIIPYFNVVHFSFGPQESELLSTDLLNRYKVIADK